MSESNAVQTKQQKTEGETKETQEVNVPEGYIPEQEFDERFQKKFDKHREDFQMRGQRQLARTLGLNPDHIDLSDPNAIKSALDEQRDLEKNLDAERIEKVKKEVEKKYEPVIQERDTYKNRLAEMEIISAAQQAGFNENVTSGDWKQEFVRDVASKTKVMDTGERVVVDEDGQPMPSSEPGKTYQSVSDLLSRMRQEGRWKIFANGSPQKSDSGFSEGTTTVAKTGNRRSDYKNRIDFIDNGGTPEEWMRMPE